jgi:hypothetical protein
MANIFPNVYLFAILWIKLTNKKHTWGLKWITNIVKLKDQND